MLLDLRTLSTGLRSQVHRFESCQGRTLTSDSEDAS
jgi:hypothetical protein